MPASTAVLPPPPLQMAAAPPRSRSGARSSSAHAAAVPWADARRLAHAAAEPLPPADVALAESAGATLAGPLHALGPMPPFDTAAMDGFAVRGPGPYRLVGRVPVGHSAGAGLRLGEAVEIATGAVVPAGADAVLPIEDAWLHGDEVARKPGAGGGARDHIRRRGSDAGAGELLAPAGAAVTPALIGLAAAAGHDRLQVAPRARVAVLVTGDELVHAGIGGDGRIRDALGPMLPALIASLGGEMAALAHVPDQPARRLPQALDCAGSDADVVVVTGSTSVGRCDRLRELLGTAPHRLVVDGVACRPGHPQLLGSAPGGRWVVGLPGNPLAALVAAHTLLGPLLAGLAGRPLPALPHAHLAPAAGERAVAVHQRSTRLIPVVWDGAGVRALPGGSSAHLAGAATADALAAVAPGWAPGTPVPLVGLR